MEHNQQDNIQNSMEINTASNQNVHSPPILGKDKQYHLFLSHSSQDEAAIIPILDILEADPYNLKCCIDRRDFMLGETMVKNINYALNQSLGTVVFLTPEFLQSNYCKHEVETAFAMYMEGEGRVIPVILKPCTVPNEFRTIQYIDEGMPEKEAERIYTCLTIDPKDLKKGIPLNPIHAGQKRMNGNRFTLPVTDILDRTENEDVSQEDFITQQQKRDFEKVGIEVDNMLISLLQMVVYLPVHKAYYRKPRKKFFIILSSFLKGFVLINILAMLITLVGTLSQLDTFFCRLTYMIIFMLPASLVITVIIMVPWAVFRRLYDVHSSHKFVKTVNQLSVVDRNCCFGLRVTFCSTAILSVVKYDISACEIYLARKYEEIQDQSNTRFDNVWTAITKSKLYSQYFKRLYEETLPCVFEESEERHLVVNGKVCFCQYLEKRSDNVLQKFSSKCEVVDKMEMDVETIV